MKRLLEFWEEDNGQLSGIRLYSTVAIVIACIISLRMEPSIDMLIIWMAGAFAPKVVQKLIEKYSEKKLS